MMHKPATTTVTVQRVMRLLDAYGADPQRWPDQERAAAVALLVQEPELQRYRDEISALDEFLHCPLPHSADANLADRIMRALPAPIVPQKTVRRRFWRLPYPAMTGLIMGCGVTAGIFIYHSVYQSPPSAAMSAVLEQWLDEQLLDDSADAEMQTLAVLEPAWFEDE